MGESNNNKLASVSLLHLPVLPDTLLQLIEECAQPSTDSVALQAIFERDVALATRLLDLSSAVDPTGLRITRVTDMLDDVGLDSLRTLSIAAAVGSVLDDGAGKSMRRQLELRRSGLKRGLLARHLAVGIGYPTPAEAYFAGFLQVLGELAIDSGEAATGEASPPSLGAPTEAGIRVADALVRDMALDSLLADALLYCREPQSRMSASHPLIKIANAANALASEAAPDTRSAVADLLRLTEEELTNIALAAQAELQRIQPAEHEDLQRCHDARLHLVEHVRRQGLLSNTRPKFDTDAGLNGVLLSVRKSLHILFGHRRSFVFMFDAQRETLQGVPLGGDNPTLAEFVLPCTPGVSTLCNALLQSKALPALPSREGLLVDQIILRQLGQPALICLPLIANNARLGVIAIGIANDSPALADAQLALLTTFAQQASYAIARQIGTQLAPALRSADSQNSLESVAGELSNPLSIIKNYVKILRLKLALEDSAQPSLGIIDAELDRVNDIVRDSEKHRSPLPLIDTSKSDVNETIVDIVRIDAANWARDFGTVIRTDLRHNIAPLAFDPLAFKQVLLNLVRNAAEAMPTGGEIIIATRGDYASEDGRACVEIIVKDNGPGIPPQIQEKLFQPVHSTKGAAHAGLGLHVVRNLVMQMGGVVQCRSTAWRGTLFQILLPQAGRA